MKKNFKILLTLTFWAICMVFSYSAYADSQPYIIYEENMEQESLYDVLKNIRAVAGKQEHYSLVVDKVIDSEPLNKVIAIDGKGEALALTAEVLPYAKGETVVVEFKFKKLEQKNLGWTPARIYGAGVYFQSALIHYDDAASFRWRESQNNPDDYGLNNIMANPTGERYVTLPNQWYRMEITFTNINDDIPSNRRYQFRVFEISPNGEETLRFTSANSMIFQWICNSVQLIEIQGSTGITYFDDIKVTTSNPDEVAIDRYRVVNDNAWLTQEITTAEDFKAITETLNLPTKGAFKSDIIWESSKPSVVNAQSGEVFRQSTDVVVALTAIIKKGSATPIVKEFEYCVKTADVSDEEAVELAASELFVPNSNTVTANFDLPSEGIYNTELFWSSADEDVVSIVDNRATVNRTSERCEATISALVKRGEAEKTVDFKITVLESGYEQALCDYYQNFAGTEIPEELSIITTNKTTENGTVEIDNSLKVTKTTKSSTPPNRVSALAVFENALSGQEIVDLSFSTNAETATSLTVIKSSVGNAVVFGVKDGNLFAKMGTPAKEYVLASHEPGKIHNVQMRMNSHDKTAAIYIDGQKKTDDVNVGSYSNISSVGVELFSQCSVTVKEIKVYADFDASVKTASENLKIEGVNLNRLTQCFDVPVEGADGVEILWESSDESVLEFNGGKAIVKRPSHEGNNTVVKISATVSKQLASRIVWFDAVVLRELSPEEKCTADIDALIIPDSMSLNTITSVNLPENGANGSVFNFESSNEALLTSSGTLVKMGYMPNRTENVILTVTAECEGVSVRREFNIFVSSNNFAHNTFASASTSVVGFSPVAAIDQNEESCWMAESDENTPWLKLDLYTEKEFNQLRLKAPNNSTSLAKIEYSSNGIEWNELLMIKNPSDEYTLFEFDAVCARYLRFSVVEKGLEQAGLSEIQLFFKEGVNGNSSGIINKLDIENKTNITESFTLPESVEGYEINWESSDSEIIRIKDFKGVVTRPSATTSVVLTARISVDNLIYSKNITVTVKGNKPGGSSGNSSGGGGGGKSKSPINTVGSVGAQVPVLPPQSTSALQNGTIRYSDVADNFWAKEYIDYLTKEKITNGKGNSMFAPDDFITREEFVKLILCAFKISTISEYTGVFEDVVKGSWYEAYAETAKAMGIVDGISETVFGTGRYITREDMAVIIMRMLKKQGKIQSSDSQAVYNDSENISSYATESVATLSAAGIINGYENNTFAPKDNLTRAQAAKVIYCMLKM